MRPVTDFFAKCDESADYLVEPIIRGGLTLLAGAPKSGKTFYVCALAVEVAKTGRPV